MHHEVVDLIRILIFDRTRREVERRLHDIGRDLDDLQFVKHGKVAVEFPVRPAHVTVDRALEQFVDGGRYIEQRARTRNTRLGKLHEFAVQRFENVRRGKNGLVRRHALRRPVCIHLGNEILVLFGEFLEFVVHLRDVGDRGDHIGHVDVRRRKERAPLAMMGKRFRLPLVVEVARRQRDLIVVRVDGARRRKHGQIDRLPVHPAVTPVVFTAVQFRKIQNVRVRLCKRAGILLRIVQCCHCFCFSLWFIFPTLCGSG